MTGLHAATYRTERLTIAGLECPAAVGTISGRIVTGSRMVTSHRAGTAISATSRCRTAAVCAMLGVLCRCAEFAPMLLLVAWDTERDAIIEIGHKLREISNGLYVVSMKVSCISAMLTDEAVSFVDRLTPLRQITLRLGALASQTFSAFPCSGVLTDAKLSCARTRAEARSFVPAVEHIAASGALSGLRWVAMRPADFRAILCTGSAISLDEERSTADGTGISYLRVFHGFSIPHNTQNAKSYCAVALQRFFDMTQQAPVLLEGGAP